MLYRMTVEFTKIEVYGRPVLHVIDGCSFHGGRVRITLETNFNFNNQILLFEKQTF